MKKEKPEKNIYNRNQKPNKIKLVKKIDSKGQTTTFNSSCTFIPSTNSLSSRIIHNKNNKSSKLMKKIAQTGSIVHIDNISDEAKKIFVTAHDVSPYWHVKMQAAFQLHTDNAVSKTVNFEEHATRKDIEDTYILAYENNLKGITVYRNNSRQFQPMNLETKPKEEEVVEEYNPTGEIKTVKCPECGNEIQMAEGCFICPQCGYSGCS